MNCNKSLNFDGFVNNHIFLPLLLWLLAALCLYFSQIDLWLAQHFYNADLHLWPYREHWLLQKIIHKGGRNVVYALGGGMLVCLLLSSRSASKLAQYRRALLFLVIAGMSGPLLVTYFKNHSHIYCPWDLNLFGGNKPHIQLFDRIDTQLTVGHCFPAGHSSLGFTLVNLYFFCLVVKPAYRYYGLAAGLIVGSLFAMAQEIRGAHFLSHDLCSLALCWFSSAVIFWVFFRLPSFSS